MVCEAFYFAVQYALRLRSSLNNVGRDVKHQIITIIILVVVVAIIIIILMIINIIIIFFSNDLDVLSSSSSSSPSSLSLSFSVLTWAIYYIATHPELDKKMYEEIKAVLGDKDVDHTTIGDLV